MTKDITPGPVPDIMAISNRQIEEQRALIRGDIEPEPDKRTLSEFLKEAGVLPNKITDVSCRILSRVVGAGNPISWGRVLSENTKHWQQDFYGQPISPEARRAMLERMTAPERLDFIHREGRSK